MSLSKKESKQVPLEKGPQTFRTLFGTPFFECDPKAEYWTERETKGPAYVIVLLRDKYKLPNIRGDKRFSYGTKKENEKEEKPIQGQIIVTANSLEDAKAYIFKERKTLGAVFGVVLPEKSDEQDKFWNELIKKLGKV